jgi:LruC domain-containing protein
MKVSKFTLFFSILFFCGFTFYSCLDDSLDEDNGGEDLEESEGSYADFDFETVQEYQVSVSTLNNQNESLENVYLEMFTTYPLDDTGTLVEDSQKLRVFKGQTNSNGLVECKLNPSTSTDSLYVLTYYVGLPSLTTVALEGETVSITIGGSEVTTTSSSVKVDNIPAVDTDNGYYILGDWGSKGLPEYLESDNDDISNEFLERVNASLPEYTSLLESHPEYLTDSDDANIVMVEDGELWVTFVHEGAGWTNSLGYYTYETGNAPESIDDIEDLTIIFPNVSMGDSDQLSSGNKVQLLYLDQENNEFQKLFPAGRTIGWFLVAQGWQSSSQNVGDGYYTHYSNSYLNIESSSDLQKHNVLLYDEETEHLVLGFEDVNRSSSGCDQDFNDAVFYATYNPLTAVNTEDYQEIDDASDDSDEDGIRDEYDEYPEDATKAFNNYYVAEGEYGSLAFEDLWPSKGDYDFNDLVVDYNFNQITNADNNIVQIDAKLLVKAIGASYKNAFGLSLETTPDNIESVTGQRITDGFLSIASNGTEESQSKATIICFDNPYNVIDYPGSGSGVNTDPDSPSSISDTLEMSITFVSPIDFDDFETPPYNPFIIINQNRDKEVHLPYNEPTDLADTSLFGTYDDDSDLSTGDYYVSDQYLPWAINIPVSFDYPSEKNSILDAYLLFDTWASSNGNDNDDWYMDESGYRDSDYIYSN